MFPDFGNFILLDVNSSLGDQSTVFNRTLNHSYGLLQNSFQVVKNINISRLQLLINNTTDKALQDINKTEELRRNISFIVNENFHQRENLTVFSRMYSDLANSQNMLTISFTTLSEIHLILLKNHSVVKELTEKEKVIAFWGAKH